MNRDSGHVILQLLAALLLLFLTVPLASGQVKQGLQETVIRVDGMICSSCAATVEQALRRLGGVTQAQADVQADSVRVRYDGKKVTPLQLVETIRKAGYRARPSGERALP
ncbi:MAG TPA: heavy-metal-associated domain-containing protein [Geobacteraceae bacterium]|jgi:copper chaperone CopZ